MNETSPPSASEKTPLPSGKTASERAARRVSAPFKPRRGRYHRNRPRNPSLAGVATTAKAAKGAAKIAYKTTRTLLTAGPAGWVVLSIVVLIGIVMWLVFYFYASAGNLAPEVRVKYDPAAHPGLTEGIPTEYLRLYETAAEQWEIPWQVIAAWGDVATSHGRYSPYDCVQRINPDGLLAHTEHNTHPLLTGYLNEIHGTSNPKTTLGWTPTPPENTGSTCGAYGWLHQWCSDYTGLSPLAPDPPIAPSDKWETADKEPHTPWQPSWDEYEFVMETTPEGTLEALFCVPAAGNTWLDLQDGNYLCGPMLINPAKVGISCAELQNPAVSINIVAEEISSQIANEIYYIELPTDARTSARTNEQDNRTNASIFHQNGVILYESEREELLQYATSPVEAPYSTNTRAGLVLRSTSELFPAYWAVAVDKAILKISDLNIGQEPRNCSDTLNLPFDPVPGDPTIFEQHTYCHLRTSAPAYHDWRLAGYANEGVAVGELAARLWTEDLMIVSWVWNEWGNPRSADLDGNIIKPAEPGNTCREITTETQNGEQIALYAGTWLPFPGVSCEDIAGWERTEPEEAARRLQLRGWGGFSGYVRHSSSPQGCPAPAVTVGETTYSDSAEITPDSDDTDEDETETTPENSVTRTWYATFTWEHHTNPGQLHCPLAGLMTPAASPAVLTIAPAPELTAEISNSYIEYETASEPVSASCVIEDPLELVWRCTAGPVEIGMSVHTTPPVEENGVSFQASGVTSIKTPWWHLDVTADPFSEPSGCGDPYASKPVTEAADPSQAEIVRVCETTIIWPWMTTGWNCPAIPLGSQTLPSGHDYFPAARIVPKQTCVSGQELSAPALAGRTATAPTRPSAVPTGNNLNRPLLPSLAFPAIASPAPHTHTGWTEDERITVSAHPFGQVQPFAAAQGWTAAKEIAYRARWLAGGVQTEHDGNLNFVIGNSQRVFITQSRSNPASVCGLGASGTECEHVFYENFAEPELSDTAETDISAPLDLPEIEKTEINCANWQLPAGETCANWAAIAARASIDKADLSGHSRRNSQQQYDLRRQHCSATSPWEILSAPLDCDPPTAPVGSSLHQHGYAVDLDNAPVNTTSEYVWMATHAWRWGYYNLESEPWHWSTTGA